MKILKSGLSLVLLGAGLAALPGLQSAAVGVAPTGAAADQSLVQRMRGEASGAVRVTNNRATGKVGFIRATGNGDLMPSSDAGSTATSVAKANAYLEKYAGAFGATADQLEQEAVVESVYGTTVTYSQQYRGVPVFGAMLRVNVDQQGDLTSVNGQAVPVGDLSTSARLSAAQAGARAVAAVRAAPPASEDGKAGSVAGIKAKDTSLFVYRNGLIKGAAGRSEMVYRTEVTNGTNVRDIVFVSANTGKLVNRYSMLNDALNRELYEVSPDTPPVWKEGDPFPGTLNEQQQNLVQASGESYHFFFNSFGRDSYDDAGATMKTVNNDPTINCPNANWNGQTTNYCDGVTSDDVVAHEWGHAYTEYTWGGIYQYQPGALNESYSDIWGETVDLINGREDEGEGNIAAKRPVGLCAASSPVIPLVTITSPPSIAKVCATGGYLGPATFDPITRNVVVGLDEANPGGPTTTDGCTPYTNAAAVNDKIALVDRGTCTFVQKANMAKLAGVAALIIGNRDNAPIGFGDSDQTLPPTVSIGLNDRELIKNTLGGGTAVTARIEDAGGERVDSFRWLVGEKSTAFGGAIRDMWEPTCYGDPGKVSDAEYKCSTDDSGGVHSNSGVPNHGFALLVDGGTFNGVTVPAIGHTKAAHIYYRAMTAYQTPSSDFTDHADALEASCTDLTGRTLNGLSTGGSPEDTNAPPPLPNATLTAADCAAVDKMADAVELRKEPVQCNFQPLLAPGTLNPCGRGTATQTVFSEDFEDGLAGWTPEEELAPGADRGFPWIARNDAPGNHPGGVAYAPDPSEGSCAPGDDVSSRNSIISPELTVPSEGTNARVFFEHYVATEGGYDGGNVKASVNGSPFGLIPAGAFVFNPYNTTMLPGPGNTSPIKGQPGFSGTDGGEVTGSWGESQISLGRLGVVAGDKLKLRFDFGRDGCGGLDGWYVDNVTMTVCKKVADLTVVHVPEPSTYGRKHALRVTMPDEATGQVTAKLGAKTLGTATVSSGQATIALPRKMPAGKHTVSVSYSGDETYAPRTETLKITIKKAKTIVRVIRTKPVIDQVKVKVKSRGLRPAGRVKVLRGGKVVGQDRLNDRGVAVVDVRNLRFGQVLVARYSGAPNYRVNQYRFTAGGRIR